MELDSHTVFGHRVGAKAREPSRPAVMAVVSGFCGWADDI